jgi:hypothetical protein
MIYYIIYETTNQINGKKYRGAHVCEDLNYGYLGSGTNLKQAMRKYGKHQFSREIIYMAFDYDAMWAAEAIFVDQDWISRPDVYNISLGGRGSRGFQRQITDEQRQQRSLEAKARWLRPDYRQKNCASQRRKAPPSPEARLILSLAGKGIANSTEHNENISKGLKQLFTNPDARLKRSEQSTKCNARPEVRHKIAQALTGIKRSDATRQKSRSAAQKRVQNPEYLEAQRISQTKRWQECPATWWNNGIKNIRSVDKPGEEFQPGRISFGTWWTNGQKSVMSIECPGDGWSPGRRINKGI